MSLRIINTSTRSSSSAVDGLTPVTSNVATLSHAINIDQSAVEFWRSFGFQVAVKDNVLSTVLPSKVIAFQPQRDADARTLWMFLDGLGQHPNLFIQSGESNLSFYRLAKDADVDSIRAAVPAGVTLRGPGDVVELPSGESLTPEYYQAAVIGDLLLFNLPASSVVAEDTGVIRAIAEPLMAANPLQQYSLRGRLAELEAAAIETRSLLGNVALAGQATIIYAPPGSGKTLLTLFLIMAAITAGRVVGGNVYYVNADDSSSGVADKMRLLEECGAHMLVPGLQGFSGARLLLLMREMVETDTCHGVVIVVDTLKKVVDLMDKRDSRAFGQLVRECVAKGATFVGLAHTNKNARQNGKLVHAGTTDLLEDVDAACVLTPLSVQTGDGEKVVQFEFLKRRGGNVAESFAYADDSTGSYDELLASVRIVDPDKLDRFVAKAKVENDEPVIAAIITCIEDGVTQKMSLAHGAAAKAKVSARAAIKVIERYQGDDPELHRWTYSIEERGAKVYRLLTS